VAVVLGARVAVVVSGMASTQSRSEPRRAPPAASVADRVTAYLSGSDSAQPYRQTHVIRHTVTFTMSPKTTTTMRIDDDLLEGLQTLKQREGVPVSEQVRRAIRAWLEQKGMDVKAAARRVSPRRRA
jgi:ribbon-helix-helix CopG family protein